MECKSKHSRTRTASIYDNCIGVLLQSQDESQLIQDICCMSIWTPWQYIKVWTYEHFTLYIQYESATGNTSTRKCPLFIKLQVQNSTKYSQRNCRYNSPHAILIQVTLSKSTPLQATSMLFSNSYSQMVPSYEVSKTNLSFRIFHPSYHALLQKPAIYNDPQYMILLFPLLLNVGQVQVFSAQQICTWVKYITCNFVLLVYYPMDWKQVC